MFPSLQQASDSNNDKLSCSTEEMGGLGVSQHGSTLVLNRCMTLPWNPSLDVTNHSS
jgi:hypothetical protein